MHEHVLRRRETTGRQALTIPLLAVPTALACVRDRVRRHCAEWECGAQLGDMAALCASELVTNVIVHVGEGVPVSVRLSWARGLARLAVTDPDPDSVPAKKADVLAPGAESGRGLLIVDTLAVRWGVERYAGAKTVWCELPAPSERPHE